MRPLMDWYELRLRLRLWCIQSWSLLLRPIVWLRFLFVDRPEGASEKRQGSPFGKFRRTEVSPANRPSPGDGVRNDHPLRTQAN
jgi:hypothetical protein